MALLVTGIYVNTPGRDLRPAVARRLRIPPQAILAMEVVRQSLDARHRPPRQVLNLRVDVGGMEEAVLASAISGVRRFEERDEWRAGRREPGGGEPSPRLDPVIVGAGPAGLFAALRLAEAGVRPLLLERGGPVEERRRAVARAWRGEGLDPEDNVMFGEGGAGAFSDGKLRTRRREGAVGAILAWLVRCGAPPAIQVEAHPHLGTDRLRHVIRALREELLVRGAEVRFRSRVDGLLLEEGRCVGVRLADGQEVRRGPVVLAPGHSARDTQAWLLAAGVVGVVRPIAVGVRVEHPRVVVDQAMHGASHRDLPAARYGLVSAGERAAWTFCMCPGGIVIPASNHDERVVVNGMSMSSRGSPWSNAAVVVPVDSRDYGADDPLAGVRFQDVIEERAWRMGGGAFRAPGQRVADFLGHRASRDLPRVSHPLGATPTDLHDLLPPPVCAAIGAALRAFDARIPGFSGPGGVLLAPETRTTSPVRFLREKDRSAAGVPGLYLVGEGAGWAGGITSAALDGWKTAEAILAGG